MIKIAFSDFHREFDKSNNFIINILNNHFGGYILSDHPDFLFYSCQGTNHKNYNNCVKIFFTPEPVTPNFNECDYAIGFDSLQFNQRYCKRPYWLDYPCPDITQANDNELLNRKFCNFIYSNETNGTAVNLRKKFALELMKYKHIDCPGKVLNNMSNASMPRYPAFRASKLSFIQNYKFTIAFENCTMAGYTTEKMEDPLLAHSIPIYWGNPDVENYFNPKAFINCNQFEDNFDYIINKIIELDTHDDLYLDMIRQPAMQITYQNNKKQILENFLVDIIKRGNVPFEKDPLGFSNKMSVPQLSTKQLFTMGFKRILKKKSV